MNRFTAAFSRVTQFFTKSLTIIRDNFIPVSAVSQSIVTRVDTHGLSSNVVMAPVFWIMRTFTEATLVVQSRNAKGVWNNITDHDVEVLVDRPNPVYDGDTLWKATVISYTLDGNAYWRKVRNAIGEVIELWYMPHWLVKPVGSVDGSTLISHYEYLTGLGPPIPLATRDVVHFRFGLDPENVRYGFSPLRPLLREVMTDDQAAQFSETILRNMGVPGLIVSPKNDAWKPSDEETKKLRDYFESAFSGERRGKPFVMKIPTEVNQFGFDPNKLMLSNLRDISEERVCAAFGIPSAVVGFGSGLQSTKVGATMRELRRLAWVQCLTPMQTTMAKQLTAQLLTDFVGQPRRFRARFDTSDVSAFPEDESMRAERVRGLVKDGVITVAYAQELLGLEIDPSRDVYLGPGAIDAEPVEAETPPEAIVGNVEDEEEPNDSADDDDAKLLRAISARWASTPNGNGKH